MDYGYETQANGGTVGGGTSHDLRILLSFYEIHVKNTLKLLWPSAGAKLLLCLIRETRCQQMYMFSNAIMYKLYTQWDSKTNKLHFSSYEKCTLLVLLPHCTVYTVAVSYKIVYPVSWGSVEWNTL